MARTKEAMDLRRAEKFDRHNIIIIPQRVAEERKGQLIDFNFAVLQGKRLVGRTQTNRSAKKRAHQHIRNLNR